MMIFIFIGVSQVKKQEKEKKGLSDELMNNRDKYDRLRDE